MPTETLIRTTLAALLVSAASARADTIIGVFDPNSVMVAGNVLNDPQIGDQAFSNNTGTAVYSITNGASSTISWGTNTPAGADTFSSITFQGGEIPGNGTSSFTVGQISFLNGTSTLASLIFGVTINFYDNSVSASNFLGADQIIINTTSNQYSGTGLTLAQLQTDADYINICGNNSNICDNPLEAYEDSEGGVGVIANLTGTLVGDPQLLLQNIALAPGQNPQTSGFIGNGPPLATPEPSSLALLVVALTGLFGLRRAPSFSRS